MNPQQPEVPAYHPAQSPTNSAPAGGNKRKILALWLLIAPTALIIGAILLYAVVNFAVASTSPTLSSGELTTPPSPLLGLVNIILFLVGTVSVITWLPGIIAGIILLSTAKKS